MNDFIVTPLSEQWEDDGRTHYPTAHKLAIQARQSTKRQAENNKESYEAQTKAHYRKALRLGWVDADIMMFIENKRKDGKVIDASGTLRMDQRPTLQELIHYVERDEVKAIMTRGVDRLFRHIDMIEPAIFAKICKQHDCIIITDTHVYDFNKRYEDTKLFLQEAQAGADYIKKHIGMMLQYKQEKALRGEYDGRMVPVGFVLDEDRLWYVEYEPHSRVVRWLFHRFRELSGNTVALWKEVYQVITEQGYLFPAFPTHIVTPSMALHSTGNGYSITESGLKGLLVNTAYLGWWLVYETIDKGKETQHKVLRAKREDNHPAIVDVYDFWYAYERLAEQPQKSRYTKVGTIPSGALLDGVLTAEIMITDTIETLPVYVYQNRLEPNTAQYTICKPTAKPYVKTYGSIGVRRLDHIFTTHLLAKLEKGKAVREKYAGQELDGVPLADLIEDYDSFLVMQLEDVLKQQTVVTAGMPTQLAEYREEAESLDRTLHYGAAKLSPEKIAEYAERLARLHVSIDQITAKQKRAQATQEELAKFGKRLDDIPAAWKDMSWEDKVRFIRLVVNKMIVRKPMPDWVQIDIQWLWGDAPTDRCYIWHRRGKGEEWTDEEKAVMHRLYSHADRQSILEALPTRSWSAIIFQAMQMRIHRTYMFSNSTLPKIVSLRDAMFMQDVGIVYNGETCWWMSVEQNGESSS